MKRIAIDIVLLPPPEIINLCIKTNRDAAKSGHTKRPLGKTDYVPHLSLGMGCIDQRKLSSLFKQIQTITTVFSPLQLKIGSMENCGTTPEPLYWLSICKSKELLRLHTAIMKKVPFTYTTNKNMFFRKIGETFKKIPRSVKNNFRKTYSFSKFKPHITLWTTTKSSEYFPNYFTASKVAVFQLGEGATCRKKLFTFKLYKHK